MGSTATPLKALPKARPRGPGRSRPSVEALILDRELPRFDVAVAEHLVVGADLEHTWTAVRDLDLMQVLSPFLNVAFWFRALPARVRRRSRHLPPPPEPTLRVTPDNIPEPWVSFGQTPGREVAFGVVGKFGRPAIEWFPVDVAGFSGFHRPGFGKIGASLSVRPYGERRTLLTYEVRVATTDMVSRRRFARYWLLIRPFVINVMRASLRQIRRNAEASR